MLKIDSKDIDVEIYGLSSFSQLERILEEFGEVNVVGKSFGVCKLLAFGLDLDFSFPRKDSKVSDGHKGFDVKITPNIDFKTAASRRDFTINAIGYDIVDKRFLDPYDGMSDLKEKTLRAVDVSTFGEDPLRVLRAVQFSSRFDFTLERELFFLCKNMVGNGALHELPKERIFEEIKKLLLKSKKISNGVSLLRDLGAFEFFTQLKELEENQLYDVTSALDKISLLKSSDSRTDLVLTLSTLCHKFDVKESEDFLEKMTDDKKLISCVLSLVAAQGSVDFDNFNDFDIYLLATKIKTRDFVLLSIAINSSPLTLKNIAKLEERAKELNVLSEKAKALLRGKDLLDFGLEPSREFSVILKKAYLAQMRGAFFTREQALNYLKKELLS